MSLLAIALFGVFLGNFLAFSESDVDSFTALQSRAGTKNLKKRNIITFPPDSVLQVNMGITLAGQLEKNRAVIVLAFQQNALLPTETPSLFSQSLVVKARKFSVYDYLRDVITSYGLNGSECLRKMICQIGETPLLGGLVEDIITFVLSPSKHRKNEYENIQADEDIDSLLESERLGRLKGNCTALHPLCFRTPLDFISTYIQLFGHPWRLLRTNKL